MGNKESVRRPTPEELLLIEYLAQKGQYRLEADWQQSIWVEPITEESMGVAAYLLVDGTRSLCKLDLWKYDDTEILSLPSSTDKFEDIPMGK